MKIRLYLFLVSIIYSVSSSAQNTAESDLTPKYSNEFLTIGVGARSLGMSLAQVASVGDITAGYWNPAGLLNMKGDIQAAAMHSEYFAGIAKYDYAAIGKQLDSVSAASISFIRFGVDDIPNTTELIDAGGNIDYNRITTFSAADYAFIFSYAHRGLPFLRSASNFSAANEQEGFQWGASAKIIYRQIGDFANAWGFGIDAGVQYHKNGWHFGASARDVTSTFNAWSFSLDERTKEVFEQTNNDLPENGLELTLPRFILGAAKSFQFNKVSLLTEINATATTDGRRNTLISSQPFSIDPSLGFEVGYMNTVFFRGGMGNIQRVTNFDNSESIVIQPNIGVGLRIRQFFIDYALSDIGNVSDVLYSNVFSLRYEFLKK
ncbi:MAG: hypothetical protein ACK4WD_10505 [Flavobacteriales bacterium]|jgi:hypothetical protein